MLANTIKIMLSILETCFEKGSKCYCKCDAYLKVLFDNYNVVSLYT